MLEAAEDVLVVKNHLIDTVAVIRIPSCIHLSNPPNISADTVYCLPESESCTNLVAE